MKKIRKKAEKRRREKTSSKKGPVFLRRATTLTGGLAIALLIFYFSFGYFFDRGFIRRDLGEKIGKVLGETTLTMRIIGPPAQPVLSANPICTNYVSHVVLSWTHDDQTDYFDLERNGSPLAAGLTEDMYDDEAVTPLETYSYAVTAFNQAGQNASETVTVTALDCGAPPSPPVLTANPKCDGYNPHIELSWTSVSGANYYNLERDGDFIALNLAETEYNDTAVEKLESYTYAVTAYTVQGSVKSEDVAVTAPDCGSPPPPVLTATPVCVDNNPYINLSWTADDEMDYFDLERNSSPLASNLTKTEYADGEVVAYESYSYVVTAYSPWGQKKSNTAMTTALDCSEEPPPPPPPSPLPDPTCVITKFQNINLSNYAETPSTKERMPRFYGTTNMPGAEIGVVISGKSSMIAEITANENGYWHWRPQTKLNYGLNRIEATAVDPDDSSRTKTAALNFRVRREEEKEGEERDGEKKKIEETVPGSEASTPAQPTLPEETPIPPAEGPAVDLSVQVLNPDKVSYPGKDLSVETKISLDPGIDFFRSEIRYWIVDEEYNQIYQTSDQIMVKDGLTIKKNLPVPRLVRPGKYKIIVDISRNGTVISSEDLFTVKEIPIAKLGGGVVITATQIMANLFWVILWLFVLLIIFLILLGLEYLISRRAIMQITEETLREKGFITKKKTT